MSPPRRTPGRGHRFRKNPMVRFSTFEPKWRNWQTRYVQGVVGLRPSGFKSLLRHLRREARGNRGKAWAAQRDSAVYYKLCPYFHK